MRINEAPYIINEGNVVKGLYCRRESHILSLAFTLTRYLGDDDYSGQNPVRLSIISRAYSSDECRRRRQYVMSNVPGTLLIALYRSIAGSLPSHVVAPVSCPR